MFLINLLPLHWEVAEIDANNLPVALNKSSVYLSYILFGTSDGFPDGPTAEKHALLMEYLSTAKWFPILWKNIFQVSWHCPFLWIRHS